MERFRTEIYIHVERVFSIATYMYLRIERYKYEMEKNVYFNMAEYSVSITDSLSTSKIFISYIFIF